ncbi:aminoglycoside phosphotransferase family protein [Aerococcaceae bacterium NML160702]|nr:aminoglycoside phosphotransferase family protein [Aerococcaceae bacterium NML190073]MCW6666063.1 aminoglycoside phosphotransferase family protein [Aerococcaceae bacterium NML190938]MCW6681955.1 aminoglycoside phosphotransferase family protein [Aerococcaceae bacterium NML160702]
MTECAIHEVYAQYELPGELVSIMPFGKGLINRTYEIIQQEAEGLQRRYVLQCINHTIFPDVAGLMNNILLVTDFLKGKSQARGGNPERETLTVVMARDGKPFVQAADGSYWRIYPFVEGTFVLDQVENDEQFYETGRSFGAFQAELSDFDATQLVEVIPMFHDTRNRYRQFEEAVLADAAGRVKDLTDEIDFVRQRKADCFFLYDLLDAGDIPLRVTHNDTKLNNILMDNDTKKGICIVDLDTIMPGISLFDFGDSIRYGANDCAEDEADMNKVNFDAHLFEVYARGFLAGANGLLTEREVELLPWGARVITLEQGIRFLTDYINGDVYYGTTRPGQNLDRTHTQFKLVQDMEAQWDELQAIIARSRG